MPGQRNPRHVSGDRHPVREDPDPKGLQERNEASWRGPGEEPRNIRKAGGGTKGMSLGGAHTGRYGPAPAKVTSNREPKPRGSDAEE